MIEFSLIMATYGRKEEIGEFLKSIMHQQYDISKIEIIIIDQNDKICLDSLILPFNDSLKIIHIKSSTKGLSFNRNIGLKKAKGKYIAFPDDDCRYYPDTLTSIQEAFDTYNNVDIILGKIYDRELNKNIIRKWKANPYKVTFYNFFTSYSSITIFSKRNNIFFDDELGVGQYFGSCEDADYILQALEHSYNIQYTPSISVWHPEFSADVMSYEKIYSYGLGFGALCRKHCSLPVIYLSGQVFGFHILKFIIALIKLDTYEMKKRYLSIVSRLNGFLKYEIK